MNSAVECRALSKIYRNGAKEVRAVDVIDLKIDRGEFFVIMGPSGAGKSTLLHLLGGLDRPTGGGVWLSGMDLYAISDAQRARIRNEKIGFVFQFYHLLPEFTALENVMLPALIKGRQARPRARMLLESVGLLDRLDHKPSELSGGESQRVAIARALMNEPEVLLCDEPTGNLDSGTGRGVLSLLEEINKKNGLTLVIATHDESLKERADSAAHIKDGKVV